MSEPAIPFYPELLDRYDTMIKDCICTIRNGFQPDKTQLRHLRVMIKALRTDDTQSLTKKHRWLGFIQAIMVVNGITTVDTERDYTRNIFNGA